MVAHDPAVLDRISGWGWQKGLRPGPKAPVWRMNTFRDRFLTAYGPRHARRLPAGPGEVHRSGPPGPGGPLSAPGAAPRARTASVDGFRHQRPYGFRHHRP